MARVTSKVLLCVCILGSGACNSNDGVEAKKLREELEASRAENARLKADLAAVNSGSEVEFTDGGDFGRVNESGKYEFSFKKTYARAPELVIEVPKEASSSISYEVSDRKLDGFTIRVKGLSFDNREQLAVLMKSIKWRVTGMVPRIAK